MIKNLDSAKKQLKKLLDLLGIKATISIEDIDGALHIKLTETESALLIGFQGETLWSLQHILRLLVLRELDNPESMSTIILDVEDYRKQEEEKLREFVKKVALNVKGAKRREPLSPMSSYKRRIVHITIKEIPGVKTESFGEGAERRIIITPENGDSKEGA